MIFAHFIQAFLLLRISFTQPAPLQPTFLVAGWSTIPDSFPYGPTCLISRPSPFPCRRLNLFLLLLIAGVERNPGPPVRYGLLNVRSGVNKAAVIHDLLGTNCWDFAIFTETWFLRSDPPAVVDDIAPPGFTTMHMFRDGRTKTSGGGISLVYRKSLHFHPLPLPFKPVTFECLPFYYSSRNTRLNFISIYSPPQSLSASFFNELQLLLDSLDSVPEEVCLLGDFNCPSQVGNQINARLTDLISDRGLCQVVKCPTSLNNLLDLVITSNNSNNSFPFISPSVIDVPFSDHRLVRGELSVVRPPSTTTSTNVRDLKNLDVSAFEALLRASPAFTTSPTCPNDFANQINHDVTTAFDRLASLRTITRRKSAS